MNMQDKNDDIFIESLIDYRINFIDPVNLYGKLGKFNL